MNLLFNRYNKLKTRINRNCIGSLILGSVIAFVSLLILNEVSKSKNMEDASVFGAKTTSLFATVNSQPIHCSDSRDAGSCIGAALKRGSNNIILWLGNSQLHAINQLKQGETSSTKLLHTKLIPFEYDLITFSQPNANLREHFVLFEYLFNRLPVKTLLLPVVFDDLRNRNIRKSLSDLQIETSSARDITSPEFDVDNSAHLNELDNPNVREPQINTRQDKSEIFLSDKLAKYSELWKNRAKLRSQIFLYLYKLRNYVFRISPSSTRKLLPGPYDENMQALHRIMSSAKTKGVKIITYIAPIRSDGPIPYDKLDYSRFKNQVENLANGENAVYANLENIIPAAHWGSKNTTALFSESELEIDFMHFQFSGHQLFSEYLLNIITLNQ